MLLSPTPQDFVGSTFIAQGNLCLSRRGIVVMQRKESRAICLLARLRVRFGKHCKGCIIVWDRSINISGPIPFRPPRPSRHCEILTDPPSVKT